MPQPPNLDPGLSQAAPGADAALAAGWTWKAAREACDQHKRGSFYLSWQLTIDAPSSPAIRAAEIQRLASPCGLPWEVLGSSRAPARFETEAARWTWEHHLRRVLRSTLRDVAYMGFSVWQHPTIVNPVTLRREILTVERWPLSQVRYTATPFQDPWNPGEWIFGYYAIQFGVGATLGEVLAGKGADFRFIQLPRAGETDGHWTLVGEGDQPHLNGAIPSLDTPFVAGQVAPRARANLIHGLGRQSPVVSLPLGMPTSGDEGKAAEKVVNGLGTERAGGVLPGGSTLTGFPITTPTAGFFVEDAQITERNVAYALLGRGGSLAKIDAQYPSPVEAEVPESIVRADVGVVERSAGGVLQFVANQNNAKSGPITVTGHLPNSEQVARVKAKQECEQREAAKLSAYHAAVKAERENGFEPDQDRLDAIALCCGVAAPKIPAAGLPPVLVKVPPSSVPIEGQSATTPPASPDTAEPDSTPPEPATAP